MWRKFSFALVAVALVGVAACGGGGAGGDDDDDDDGGAQPGEFRGFFIDDTVKALQFQADGGTSGVTDEYGTYTCEPNERVTFLVDGITLGTVECLVRVVPNSFGAPGLNIARLLQSLDTTPNAPGIDLTGIDLPATPINFDQGNSSFGADPAVLAAVSVPGARGFLVSVNDALAAIAAGTGTVFEDTDLADRAFFPVSSIGENEPCLVTFNADLSGENVCRDDIDADPADAVEAFTWMIDGGLVVLDEPILQEERVTVQRLGTTGNRFSVDVVAECLVCDPNVEPVFEAERQTLIGALPLAFNDLQGQTLALSATDPANSLAFTLQANGTGTMTAPVNATFEWDVDSNFDLLRLRQTGAPGAQLFYHQLILLSGSVTAGTWVALLGEGTDSGNGVVEADEFAQTRVLQAVELLSVP